MAGDAKVTPLFLLLSVLLHLGLLAALPFPQDRKPPPEEKMRAQYVVRLPQPVPALTPSDPPPLPGPQQRPEPPALAATVQPRQPQPLDRPQRHQELTPVPEVSRRQIRPVAVEVATLPAPRQPSPPQRRVTIVHQQALPPVPEVSRPQVRPVGVEVATLPAPRHPSPHWRQATVAPQRTRASGQQDPLMAYLAQVRAAIERHKHYPTFAQRAGRTGRVVLQFVILADGRVIDPHIAESNARAALDSAALDTLRRASPMPAFPPSITQARLVVQVPISYELSRRP